MKKNTKKTVKKVEPEMTMLEFAEIVDNEGLDYAILHYFGKDIADKIDDKEMVELWTKAYDILFQIDSRIEDALNDGEDDDIEEDEDSEETEEE